MVDYVKVLKLLPWAIAPYGITAKATEEGVPVPVGSSAPIPVKFDRSEGSGFNGTLYKDPTTGKYVISIAGTVPTLPDVKADLVLAGQSDLGAGMAAIIGKLVDGTTWNPQFNDALTFAWEAFKEIRTQYYKDFGRFPTIDEVRDLTTTVGHSLGGAMAELVSKFFGLGGGNIDGPGITALTQRPEFIALQNEVAADPLMQGYSLNYAAPSNPFYAAGFTVVSQPGQHLAWSGFESEPGAATKYWVANTLAEVGLMQLGNPAPGSTLGPIAGGLIIAGLDGATNHPGDAILRRSEKESGINTDLSALPDFDFRGLEGRRELELWTTKAPSATTYQIAAQWAADFRIKNVADGKSPNGIALDGTATIIDGFRVTAQRVGNQIIEHWIRIGGDVQDPPLLQYVIDPTNSRGGVGAVQPDGTIQWLGHTRDGSAVVVELKSDNTITLRGVNTKTDWVSPAYSISEGEGVDLRTGIASFNAMIQSYTGWKEVAGSDFAIPSSLAIGNTVHEPQVVEINGKSLSRTADGGYSGPVDGSANALDIIDPTGKRYLEVDGMRTPVDSQHTISEGPNPAVVPKAANTPSLSTDGTPSAVLYGEGETTQVKWTQTGSLANTTITRLDPDTGVMVEMTDTATGAGTIRSFDSGGNQITQATVQRNGGIAGTTGTVTTKIDGRIATFGASFGTDAEGRPAVALDSLNQVNGQPSVFGLDAFAAPGNWGLDFEAFVEQLIPATAKSVIAAADATNPTGFRGLPSVPNGGSWINAVTDPFVSLNQQDQLKWQGISTTISDLQGLMALSKTKDPLYAAAFITRTVQHISGSENVFLQNLSGALTGATDAVTFVAALRRGDLLRAFSTGAPYLVSGLKTFQGYLQEELLSAVSNPVLDYLPSEETAELVKTLTSNVEAIQSVLEGLNMAIPVINAILRFRDDPQGAIVNLAAWALEAPWIAAVYTVGSLIYNTFIDPPSVGGKVRFVPAVGGVGVGTFMWEVGDGGAGGEQAVATANDLVAVLGKMTADLPDLRAVPERLPTFEYKNDDNGHWMSLTWTDPVSGAKTVRTYDLQGGRWLGQSAATMQSDPDYFKNMPEQFAEQAFKRQALVPQWQAATIDALRARGDAQAAWTTEQRAQSAGRLLSESAAATSTTNFRPIAIDLDGGGITVGHRDDGQGAMFDTNGDGFAKETDWFGPREGVLVIDRDGSEAIDSAADLFSDVRVDNAARGLSVLAEYDANGDGKLDAADPVFAKLQVWTDITHDAAVQRTKEGELVPLNQWAELSSLAALGITSINYSAGTVSRSVNGSTQSVLMAQVLLDHAAAGSISQLVDNNVWAIDQASQTTTMYAGAVVDQSALAGHTHASADGKLIVGDEQASTLEDTPLRINQQQLLDNERDVASATGLTWRISSVVNGAHGTVGIDAKGIITFTPDANFNGMASFGYTVTDSAGRIASGTAEVDVLAINDSPTIAKTAGVVTKPTLRSSISWYYETGPNPNGGRGSVSKSGWRLPSGQMGAVAVGSVSGLGKAIIGSSLVGVQSGQVFVWDSTSQQWRAWMTVLAKSGAFAVGDPDDSAAPEVALLHDGLFGSVALNSDNSWVYSGTGPDAFVVRVTDRQGSTSDLTVTVPGNPPPPRRKSSHSVGGVVLDLAVPIDADAPLAAEVAMFDLQALAGGAANLAVDAARAGRGDPAVDAMVSSQIVGAVATKDIEVARRMVDPVKRSNATALSEAALHASDVATMIASGFGSGVTPVVLDLNGGGIDLIGYRDSESFFDFSGTGQRKRTGWVDGADGLLAYDSNGNSVIDAAAEISFLSYLPGATTDLQALVAFDTNHDGKLSAADTNWLKFGVWQDDNENGLFETGELTTFADRGIASISLTTDNKRIDLEGNTVYGLGQYTYVDGSTAILGDVRFRTAPETYVGSAANADDLQATVDGASLSTGTGLDKLHGAVAKDQLYGGANDDRIGGGAGDDLIFGDAGNDTISADDGNDRVLGGFGDDRIDAGNGDDIVFGNEGDDTLGGGAGADHLYGGEGSDTIAGGTGDDLIVGGDGPDYLSGGDGNDMLYGGDGADKMAGGAGNDVYWVGSSADEVVEQAGEGTDVVMSFADFTLGANLENLLLQGTAAINATGNVATNWLQGNEGANVLKGMGGDDNLDAGAGNDDLDGGAGNDGLHGGAGDDTYRWGRGQGSDSIYETQGAGDTAQDRIVLTGVSPSDLDLQRSGNDLVLHINSTGEQLRIARGANKQDSALWVEKLVFGDGTEWNLLDKARTEADLYNDRGNVINPAVNTQWLAVRTPPRRDPLAIDLDGDGIETTTAATSPVMFDHDANGVRTGTGWLKPDDGWLVMDRNGNGSIDSGRELFGADTLITVTETPPGATAPVAYQRNARTGFEALRTLDSNGDKVFNASDAAFSQVRIWQDANQDGISQATELFTLASKSITGIQLVETTTSTNLGNGNVVTGQAVVTRSSGGNTQVDSIGLSAGNLDLGANPFYRQFTDSIALTTHAKALPDAHGSGWMRDLREAMSLASGPGLALQGAVDGFVAATSRDAQRALVDGVLKNWAATTGLVDTRTLRAVNSATVSQNSTTKTVRYWSADPSFYAAMPAGKVDAVSISFASDTYMGWTTNAAGQQVKTMNAAGQAVWEHAAVLEAVNGSRFFDMVATEPLSGGTTTTGSGLVARWSVSITDAQAADIERTYTALKESVWLNLALQTRLAPYLTAITQTQGANGVVFNGSALTTLLETKRTADAASAIGDLVDLVRGASTTLAAAGVDAPGLLAKWVSELPAGSPIKAQLTAVDVLSGSTVQGAAADEILTTLAVGGTASGGAGADLLVGYAGVDILSGGDGEDRLVGGAGSDTLNGDAGNDTLDGGAGNDTLTGGLGKNAYLFGKGDGQDQITGTTSDTTAGKLNTLQFKAGVLPSELVLKQVADAYWGGNAALEVSIAGTTDKVTISGFFQGNNPSGAYNPVQQFKFADGTTWSLAGILSVLYAGTAAADTLRGTTGADTINGAAGADTLSGGDGNDTLNGGADNDTLNGDAGNDTLDGGAGNDTLTGGLGNNVYLFGKGDGQDQITGTTSDTTAGKLNTLQFKAGVLPSELVLKQVADAYWGGNAALEVSIAGTTDKLTISGFFQGNNPSGAYNAVQQFKFADGTAWDTATIQGLLATNIIAGTVAAESLSGTSGNDKISALDGNDTLTGFAGNDWLDGGAGIDVMSGGAGNDTYVVDVAGESITELANEGNDTVRSAVTMTLAANVENLVLTGTAAINGTGNVLNNLLFGNAAANILDGGAGNDTLAGGAGNDSYVLDAIGDVVGEMANEGTDSISTPLTWTLSDNIENLTLTGGAAVNGTGNALNNVLTGNAAANVLSGGEGNDTLNGGAGADTMAGGAGNDTYLVDLATDVLTEQANGGTDTVNSPLSWSLAAELENLTLTGTAAVNGTGNAANNVLIGNGSANVLTGGAGNDSLSGGAGIDTMSGGVGNDSYVVDVAGDIITELANEGTDTVSSAVTWVLGANLENLVLSGTAAINATGNALANALTGNAAANVLEGGGGNDTLSGGAGADTYRFTVGGGIDTVLENDATVAVKDVVQFYGTTPITQATTQFKHVGNNLEVWVNGSVDKLIVKDWYLATARHVEEFRFTDGSVLTDAQVQTMATAMAVFAPGSGGEMSTALLASRQAGQPATTLAANPFR